MSEGEGTVVVRGPLATCTPTGGVSFWEDAAFVSENGTIVSFFEKGAHAKFPKNAHMRRFKSTELIVPGFIEGHTHFAQMEAVGVFGNTLLDWLEKAIFPAETKWKSGEAAARSALFFDQLLSQGTTTAAVFGISLPDVMAAFLSAAQKTPMHIISGLVLMDRNAPEELTPLKDLERLRDVLASQIEEFHGNQGVTYSLCPRFAPTCTPELMTLAGEFLDTVDDLFCQSHLSETPREVQWVRELFPNHSCYADVYHSFGLLGERTLMAHGVHLTEKDVTLLHDTQTSVVHCPLANSFLGSGTFPWAKRREAQLVGALGTDVGAGTSFSLLRNAGRAYEIALGEEPLLEVAQLLELLTLKPAQALGRPDLGILDEGFQSDFVVLSVEHLRKKSLLRRMWEERGRWQDRLFLAMSYGDGESPVRQTWVGGELAFEHSGIA